MKTRFLSALLVWAIVLPAAAGAAVMTLWNLVVPTVFGLSAISFWQATALFLLCQVLSGGIVFGLLLLAGSFHTIGFHGNRTTHRHWHEMRQLRERWADMSEEERRQLMEERVAGFSAHWHEQHKTHKHE